jgi:hypothetical protein
MEKLIELIDIMMESIRLASFQPSPYQKIDQFGQRPVKKRTADR